MPDIAQVFCLGAQDIALLETCPVIAGLASLVRAWVTEINLRQPPPIEQIHSDEIEPNSKQTKESVRKRGYWVGGMLLAGVAVGFGVAFMFLGAVQPQSSAIGRVWLLALLLGFSTPTVLEKVELRLLRSFDGPKK
ncbi:hypothetical protein [Rubrivivax sp. JA1026]|uniref:hypothetical protein n=1 Tax=Rubrivivax sp. JA1026 TaxID=2710888 RepID=UPI0013E91B8C|nr:hypothetical protein [Rubrivivax sp. JA1026]